MKNLILIALILITSIYSAQTLNTSPLITPIVTGTIEKAGSCASPDGAILEIAGFPSNYALLDANGYCFNGINSTNTVTMCFTFTPTVPNILLNAGFSESCYSNSFGPFTLYDNACNVVTNSLSPTGLIVNQQYTWCVSMRAWGGGSCNGYTTFCPYWINNTPLPVEVVSFFSSDNKLYWVSLSEINNDYYSVRYSKDSYLFNDYKKVKGHGNSHTPLLYETNIDKTGYYELSQTDFDGSRSTISVIHAKHITIYKEVEGYYNIIGLEVTKTTKGLVIMRYKDGSTVKIFN